MKELARRQYLPSPLNRPLTFDCGTMNNGFALLEGTPMRKTQPRHTVRTMLDGFLIYLRMQVAALIAFMPLSSPLAQHVDDLLARTAQPAFLCAAETEGQLACMANRVCSCQFQPAVPAKGLPDRFAWDCGILRPVCEQPPADYQSGYTPYPYAVGIDEKDVVVIPGLGPVEGRTSMPPKKEPDKKPE